MTFNKIAVIGLGAIGYGLAANLARNGLPVVGADANPSVAARFAAEFGKATGPRGKRRRALTPSFWLS